MVTKEKLLEYVKYKQEKLHTKDRPIFIIYLFENPDKEYISESGKPLGIPDLGCSDEPGFFYDLDSAINAMNRNLGNIRETSYNAGFIICRFPGLYELYDCTEARMYFVYDSEKRGFYQQEEPHIFKNIAF